LLWRAAIGAAVMIGLMAGVGPNALTGVTAARAVMITEYQVPPPFGADSLVAGPDGALWFITAGDSSLSPTPRGIWRMTTSGAFTEYSSPFGYGSSFGGGSLTAGPDRALWFNAPDGIGKVTTSGAFTEYAIPSGFDMISNLTPGPDGALWFTMVVGKFVANYQWMLMRLSAAGALTGYPVPLETRGGPAGMTAGPDGALWITDYPGNDLAQVTTSGQTAQHWLPKPLGAPRSFPTEGPSGITAGPDRALWFTEDTPWSDNIGRITTSGAITEFPLPNPGGAHSITVGPDGALWFTEDADKVGRITTSGAVTEYPLPTPGLTGSITAGPDGSIWFIEDDGKKIGRIEAVPTSRERCKRGGWSNFALFKNQGECVSFLEARK
jgi:virginiamycin B lyase